MLDPSNPHVGSSETDDTESPKTFVARLFRIAPAFGFGGICNLDVKERARLQLIGM